MCGHVNLRGRDGVTLRIACQRLLRLAHGLAVINLVWLQRCYRAAVPLPIRDYIWPLVSINVAPWLKFQLEWETKEQHTLDNNAIVCTVQDSTSREINVQYCKMQRNH